MEIVTLIYLGLMFIALYMFFFFIILYLRNKNRFFEYPKAKKRYSVTVLVPAHNEEKTIEDTIRAVASSEYPLKEIIVLNDGSTDRTPEIVKKLMLQYKNLKLLDKKNSGKADSLNQGIKMAKGELIAVTDADSFPDKEAIMKIVGYFDDEKVGAVTSAVFLRNKEKFLEKLQVIEYVVLAWTRKLLDYIDSVYVTNGPLSIYRTSILREIGGFDKKSITEDIEVTWHILSAGYKTKMSLASMVTTHAPSTIKAWWRQRVRWGIGGLQVIWKYRIDFFRKGMFGVFVIPFVSVSILLSIAVFLFGWYLLARSLIISYLSARYSFIAETPIINLQALNLHPSVFIFFTLVLFITSFFYSRFILLSLGTKKNDWNELGKLFNRMFYLLLYLSLYPLVWFASIYRIIKRDFRW